MKFRRISILFILMLALNTFFSAFAFANNDENKCQCSIVALGDSITEGTAGITPFPSLIGKLGAKPNDVTNLGKSGQTSTQLLASLGNANTLDAVKHADAITLYIGGNDLLQTTGITKLLENPESVESMTEEQLAALVTEAATGAPQLRTNLVQIVGKIRAVNSSAPIVLYNLYNPIPDTPQLAIFHQLGDQLISLVNGTLINPVANDGNGVYLANAFNAFAGHQAQYVLTGEVPQLGIGVHPTAAGHQALAKLADAILKPLFPEKVLTVQLTPSTVETTKDPVTVTVQTNAEPVQALKWLPGTKVAQDFQAAGTDVKDAAFQVTENGVYTVYVKDACDREAVATIEIKNIEKPVVVDPTPNPGSTDTQNPAPQGNTNTTTTTPTTTTPVSTATTTAAATTGHALPNTATSMYNYLIFGLALVAAGFVAMKLQRKGTNL